MTKTQSEKYFKSAVKLYDIPIKGWNSTYFMKFVNAPLDLFIFFVKYIVIAFFLMCFCFYWFLENVIEKQQHVIEIIDTTEKIIKLWNLFFRIIIQLIYRHLKIICTSCCFVTYCIKYLFVDVVYNKVVVSVMDITEKNKQVIFDFLHALFLIVLYVLFLTSILFVSYIPTRILIEHVLNSKDIQKVTMLEAEKTILNEKLMEAYDVIKKYKTQGIIIDKLKGGEIHNEIPEKKRVYVINIEYTRYYCEFCYNGACVTINTKNCFKLIDETRILITATGTTIK